MYRTEKEQVGQRRRSHGWAWRGRFPGGAEQGWRSGWGDSAIHLARSRERSTLLSWLSRGVVSGAVGVVVQPCFSRK